MPALALDCNSCDDDSHESEVVEPRPRNRSRYLHLVPSLEAETPVSAPDPPFGGWVYNPDDPRGPSDEQWSRMSHAEMCEFWAIYGGRVKKYFPPEYIQQRAEEASLDKAGWHLDRFNIWYPTVEQLSQLTEAERADWLEKITNYLHEIEGFMGESIEHRNATGMITDALIMHFEPFGLPMFIEGEVQIVEPEWPRVFVDVAVVFGISGRSRARWVSKIEGHDKLKGAEKLNLCMEVLNLSAPENDYVKKAIMYAALEIPEYLVFNIHDGIITRFYLPDETGEGSLGVPTVLARNVVDPTVGPGKKWGLPGGVYPAYHREEASSGRLHSSVLGLDFGLVDGMPRFFDGDRMLLLAREKSKLDTARADAEAMQRRRADERAAAEAARADAEAMQRRQAEQQLAAAMVMIEAMKRAA